MNVIFVKFGMTCFRLFKIWDVIYFLKFEITYIIPLQILRILHSL